MEALIPIVFIALVFGGPHEHLDETGSPDQVPRASTSEMTGSNNALQRRNEAV